MKNVRIFFLRMCLLAFVILEHSSSVQARIKFCNRGAFLIEPTNSKVTLEQPSNVLGWSELSIVKSDDYKSARNWGEAYDNGVDISQEGSQAPATMLVYSNSNGIVLLKRELDPLPDMTLVYSNSNAIVNTATVLDNAETALDNAVIDFDNAVTVFDTHQTYNVDTSEENLLFFKSGFTVNPDIVLTLNTPIPVTGNINLSETGIISLTNDLYFGSNAYLTSGGIIDGNGFSLALSCTFEIPENQALHITSDTTIHGHGTTFYLQPHARIIVDNNVTLTLKNVRLKSSRNNVTNPIIQLNGPSAQLAIMNSELALGSDFMFRDGQLFIHDDVLISGTHEFLYSSPQASYICDGAMLCFERGSTFFYCPSSSDNNLINMVSETAGMCFDGATLQTTHTGIRLTKGVLCLDNDVTLSSAAQTVLSGLTGVVSVDQSNSNLGYIVQTVAWSPDGQYLAVGAREGSGADKSWYDVRVYKYDGSTLTGVASKYQGSVAVNTVAWSLDGNYLAVGTDVNPSTSETSIILGDELRVYSFDGSSLVGVASKDQGVAVNAVAWTEVSGDMFLAVGTAANPTTSETNTWLGHELRLYSFDGNSLTGVFSKGQGVAVNSVAWTSDGEHLAIGTEVDPLTYEAGIGVGDELRVYNFDTVSTPTLLAVTSEDQDVAVNAVAWTEISGSKYLAIGTGVDPSTSETGISSGDELRVYFLNVNVLDGVDSKDQDVAVNSVAWSADGSYLSIGTDAGPTTSETGITSGDELRVYSFNGSALTGVDSKDQGAIAVKTVDWNPQETYVLAIGTEVDPTTDDMGVLTGHELRVYSFDASDLVGITSLDQGFAEVNDVAWSPDGRYVAVALAAGVGGGSGSELLLYRFNESPSPTLTLVASVDQEAVAVNVVTWSPDGRYLAVGTGDAPDPDDAGIGFGHELQVYRVSTLGTVSLEGVASKDERGADIHSLSWSPDGVYLAVGTSAHAHVQTDTDIDVNHELQIFQFDTTGTPTLNGVVSKDMGSDNSAVNTVAWSKDGRYLAVGTTIDPTPGEPLSNIDTGEELQLYRFDTTSTATLVGVDSKNQGSVGVYAFAWSPDGNYLAVGTAHNPTPENLTSDHELQVYQLDGSSLTGVASLDLTNTSTIRDVAWSPCGNYITVGRNGDGGALPELLVCQFDGSTLVELSELGKEQGVATNAVSWRSDGKYLALGTELNPTPGHDSVSDNHELRVYEAGYSFDTRHQPFSSGIIFGDSSRENMDLDVVVLGGAHVEIAGVVLDDSI